MTRNEEKEIKLRLLAKETEWLESKKALADCVKKNINRLGKIVIWSIKKFTILITTYPKSKQERSYRMFELIFGLVFILLGIFMITNAIISLRGY